MLAPSRDPGSPAKVGELLVQRAAAGKGAGLQGSPSTSEVIVVRRRGRGDPEPGGLAVLGKERRRRLLGDFLNVCIPRLPKTKKWLIPDEMKHIYIIWGSVKV